MGLEDLLDGIKSIRAEYNGYDNKIVPYENLRSQLIDRRDYELYTREDVIKIIKLYEVKINGKKQ